LAVGCSDSGDASGGTSGTGSVVPNYLPIAKDSTAKAMKGTNRPVDTKPRPKVAGKKKLGIVETADFVISVQVPAQAAKAKGIKIPSIYAFDCSDPLAGNEPQGMFDGNTNFGPAATDIDAFTKSYGADQANYIIADSENQAKIIGINAPEYTVLNWTWAGFKEVIDKSGGSEIVENVEVSTPEITNGVMVQKIQAAMARHPEATWIKSPFTYVTTLGVDVVLNQRPSEIKVMGGEGFKEELDLMRKDPPTVTAVNVISSEWNGWAAIDTLNSIFRNEKPADSGIGWTIVDKDHGLPKEGGYEPPVDFKAAYKKAWGI